MESTLVQQKGILTRDTDHYYKLATIEYVPFKTPNQFCLTKSSLILPSEDFDAKLEKPLNGYKIPLTIHLPGKHMQLKRPSYFYTTESQLKFDRSFNNRNSSNCFRSIPMESRLHSNYQELKSPAYFYKTDTQLFNMEYFTSKDYDEMKLMHQLHNRQLELLTPDDFYNKCQLRYNEVLETRCESDKEVYNGQLNTLNPFYTEKLQSILNYENICHKINDMSMERNETTLVNTYNISNRSSEIGTKKRNILKSTCSNELQLRNKNVVTSINKPSTSLKNVLSSNKETEEVVTDSTSQSCISSIRSSDSISKESKDVTIASTTSPLFLSKNFMESIVNETDITFTSNSQSSLYSNKSIDFLPNKTKDVAAVLSCQSCLSSTNFMESISNETKNTTKVKNVIPIKSRVFYNTDNMSINRMPTLNILPVIGLFWDVENVRVPKSMTTRHLIANIRYRFTTDHHEAEFICACNTRAESEEFLQELNDSEVNIVHVGTYKNSADGKLLGMMRRYITNFGPGGTMVVITSDSDFEPAIYYLRYVIKMHIILVYRPPARISLRHLAHEAVPFDNIVELWTPPGYDQEIYKIIKNSDYI